MTDEPQEGWWNEPEHSSAYISGLWVYRQKVTGVEYLISGPLNVERREKILAMVRFPCRIHVYKRWTKEHSKQPDYDMIIYRVPEKGDGKIIELPRSFTGVYVPLHDEVTKK